MTNWTSGTCRANGLDIHYLRSGGARPPLLLLHGLTGSGACWAPVARAFAGEYDVLMPDARGHGGSDAPLDGYRYDDLARDVVAFIDELALAAPIVIGHSMGGMTAAVAAASAAATKLIRAVVLADPTFLSPERQREVFASDVAAQHRQLVAQGEDEVLAQLRARHPHRAPELIEHLASARLRTQLRAFDILTPPNPDYRELIAAIEVPVLLVIGDAGVVSTDTARELQAINPRLRIASMAGVGHGLHYDQPERFAAIVLDFLRSLEREAERVSGRG